MYLIDDIRRINRPENMVITQHSRKRFYERGLTIMDVCKAIDSGEIIEQYPDDFPFPSCLILGKADDKHIHVVLSTDQDIIYVITAYIPSIEKWKEDFKRRKEDKR